MTKWDDEYIKLCKEILTKGKEVENRTGINTIKIPSWHFHFDLGEEYPILETKQLFIRQALLEMMWIYQAKSNDVRWLKDRNVHIWDEWEIDEDGLWKATQNVVKDGKLVKEDIVKDFGKDMAHTIGTAYGYIVNKFGLTDRVINMIKNNPNDRRCVVSLWQDDYVPTAVLPSCVWSSEWDVTDNKLNAWVHQRSCDVPLGLPFNVSQYSALLTMLAKTNGLEPGTLDWSIKDAHIYVNQIDGIKEQVKNWEILKDFESKSKDELIKIKDELESKKEELTKEETKKLSAAEICLEDKRPELWLNPEVKSFYDYDNSKDCKDAKVLNYKHMGKIEFPIAQ